MKIIATKRYAKKDKDPCWKGYEQVGMKTKDGKEVPNCVPKNKKKAQIEVVETVHEYKGHMEDHLEQTKANLRNILEYAERLLHELDENVLEGWVMDKISTSADDIADVKHYLEDHGKVANEPDASSCGCVAKNKSRIKEAQYSSQKKMDHSSYQESLKSKSDDELRYIIQDCKKALEAFPENPNAGYYQDEIHYCAQELKNRSKLASVKVAKKSPAWQREEGKSPAGGLNEKGRKSYERENPGSDLKEPVTESNPKGKRKKRQDSYCARSKGQMKDHNIDCSKDSEKPICKSRKRWNCT